MTAAPGLIRVVYPSPVVDVSATALNATHLLPGLFPVVSPAVPRPREIESTCSIARPRLARARGPVSSPITHRWRSTLQCRLADRLKRQAIRDRLELLLIVDRHAEYLAGPGELGLEVCRFADRSVRCALALAQLRRAEATPPPATIPPVMLNALLPRDPAAPARRGGAPGSELLVSTARSR
jgi:hypothetical protein